MVKNSEDYPWLKDYPKDVSWDHEMPKGRLDGLLDEAAQDDPDAVCIDFLGKTFSYTEVWQYANKVAKGLQAMGIGKGSRVGLFMPNCPYYLFFYFGILKAGATIVNFNPLYVEGELESQIKDSKTEYMVTLDLTFLCEKLRGFTNASLLKKVVICRLGSMLPFPKNILFALFKQKEIAKIQYTESTILFDRLIENDGLYTPSTIDTANDVALFQYTGGTTGLPKAAMLTHDNVVANAQQAFLWVKPMVKVVGSLPKRFLIALPLFHVFAMTAGMNLAIRCRARMVLMFPRFNVKDAIKLIEKHKIDFFPAVPTIYNMLNQFPSIDQKNLRSLSVCLSGGAGLPIEVKKRFESLTGCTLVEAYGLSETSPAATCNPLSGKPKEGSIGIPFPQTILKILALDGSWKAVPKGEKGEICIKGPQVMKGYWNRDEENKTVMKDGFFRTGDVGYMDDQGYTYLVDRLKDLILCNGFNVYPRVIEEAIYEFPGVDEVTVIGVFHPEKGEVPKAFIKMQEGIQGDEKALKAFLEKKLSPIERPKHYEFRDTLPKTIIGKLSKKELEEEERTKNQKTPQGGDKTPTER